jgi:hypothetical protein
MLLKKNKAFEAFLQSFQEIDLPITLTEDLSVVFSTENKPLKDELIAEFIAKLDDDIDEFTEFVPCFQLKETEHFKAVVYWKGMLMESKYIIAIYSPAGEPIRIKELSRIGHDDHGVTRSIATIDEDWLIMIARGTDGLEEDYDPKQSQMLVLEILPDGQIMKTDKR